MQKDSILDFLKRTRRLSSIDRCSNTPHIKPYSVSDHSYYIAFYSMLFADLENERIRRINESSSEQEKTRLYDTSEVIKRAIIHDLEESLTGDILFPLHDENPEFKVKLDEIRNSCVSGELFSELPQKVRNYYIRLWRNSKDKSMEGKLVACMDKFEILMYAVSELEIGNHSMEVIFKNAINIIRRDFSIKSVLDVVVEIESFYKINFLKEGLL